MKILHKGFALKKMDKSPLGQLWISRATEKFTGVVGAEFSHHGVVPQGNPLTN